MKKLRRKRKIKKKRLVALKIPTDEESEAQATDQVDRSPPEVKVTEPLQPGNEPDISSLLESQTTFFNVGLKQADPKASSPTEEQDLQSLHTELIDLEEQIPKERDSELILIEEEVHDGQDSELLLLEKQMKMDEMGQGQDRKSVEEDQLESKQEGTITPIFEDNEDMFFEDLMEMAETDEADNDNTPSQEITEVQDISSKPVDSNVEELVDKGRSHLECKEFPEALKYFNLAIERDQQCWDAWSAMGDVLMEMGKIDQASICYQKAMASSFVLDLDLSVDDVEEDEKGDDTWQDYLMSFVDSTGELPEPPKPSIPKPIIPPEKIAPEPMMEATPDIEKMPTSPLSDEPVVHERPSVSFSCPLCGSGVDLEKGQCARCMTHFKEEEFINTQPLDDDLAFFSRLKALPSKEDRYFIHFDGENGMIKFLERKEESQVDKPDYILIRAEIEKLCFDYTYDGRLKCDLDNTPMDLEGE